MPSSEYLIYTIVGASMVTWLLRVLPFVFLKKFTLPQSVAEFLSFVPLVIMAAFWFSSLFNHEIGSLPTVNWENVLASTPTVVSAILSKNLLVIVITGVLSLAVIRFLA